MNFKQKLLKRRNQFCLTLIAFNLIVLVFTASLYAANWTVVLTADNGEKTAEVSFGVAEAATDGFDVGLDVASVPPSPGESLILSFPGDLTDLQTDIRDIPLGGQTVSWTLNITTKAEGKITWDMTAIPIDWNIRLEDTDMQTSGEIDFASGNRTLVIEATSSDVVPANPPTIAEVTPNTGTTAGGTTITIMGADFQPGAAVMVGNQKATAVVVTSSTTITAKTPAAEIGAVDVTVINPDGKSATSPKGFTYTSEAPPPAQKDIWIVDLQAESAGSEAKVSFGVAQDATDDYDIDYDEGLPPPSPEHIPLILSFENELTPLKIDIRGPVTSNQKIITWMMNIDSEAQGKLIWNTKDLPTGWSLNIESVDMRAVEEISFDQGHSTMTITAGKPTDINSDGKVDISDLILVGRNFGEQGGEIEGDVNGDGVVNISDLALVAEHFGIFLAP